ncbi:MAG: DUF1493 family protein [Pseudomonadales bacterium]|jgi:hypothetical protein|nr:DUF1493 family protein [Pseudomonadales bacterium]
MNHPLTLDNLIALIREHQGISPKTKIGANSFIEKDLGITGDDGCELLQVIEKEFGVSFTGQDGSIREAFDLESNQYLFNSEGLNIFWLIARLFGRDSENVKQITVGELYRAVCKVSHSAVSA